MSEFVAACSVCAPSQMPRSFLAGLLRPLPVTQGPWSHTSLDFVTDLPLSEGNHYTLVFQDGTFCCPAEAALRTGDGGGGFVSSFQLHRLPQDIVSDQGPQFAPHVFEEVLQTAQGIGKPSGQTERYNQEKALRFITSQNPSTWSQHLLWVEHTQNSLPVAHIGLSPFQCFYGYQPPLLPSLEVQVTILSAHALVRRCQMTWRSTSLHQSGLSEIHNRHRTPTP